ncbi:MAG: Coq4 family protein [Leptolyngbyaceae cyanobacterium]
MTFTDINTLNQGAQASRFLSGLHWVHTKLGLNVAPIVEMDDLRSLPPGSFGRAWADHLMAHNLEPFDHGPRRQQLHDGVHVLTGYGTDLIGEAEVQAFLLGAKWRLAHVLLLAGLLRGLARQRSVNANVLSHGEVRSRLKTAYRRGQQSGFDPDTWQPERLWELPLAEVRSMFGIDVVPSFVEAMF